MCNGPVEAVREITDTYRAARGPPGRRPTGRRAGPRRRGRAALGMNRHVVLADTDAEARDLARPAYALWYAHLTKLWRERGIPIPLSFPRTFDDAFEAGFCLVGPPSRVRDLVGAQTSAAGVNNPLCRLAFSDLPVGLLAREMLPAFAPTRR